ncbi:temptin precursor [Aplysia californica]|uniref:Temptin n=1 Tax=Aplysia californica TaxID=6500 RepID=TEMPT_APLCA|nr:temptin precursor [Aplysia californica]Q7Z0T3.1 RecName: Full=Temptin; Flags: Precursor [Aplysia californica]AAP73787.1 temptin [Aplysia californica]
MEQKRTLRVFLAVSLLCALANAYPQYQAVIPNGSSVPNPCNTSQIAQGVGHINFQGTGPLNPFGEDFKAAGKQWTTDLCDMDSDGDGRSNGVELGDPECVWSQGETPARTTDLSHPGFDEATVSC